MRRLIAASSLTVATAVFAGCGLLPASQAPQGGAEASSGLRGAVDDLLSRTGVEEVSSISIEDGDTRIVYEVGAQQFQLSTADEGDEGEVRHNPLAYPPRAPEEFPLDELQDAYVEVADECDAVPRAAVDAMPGGGVVMAAQCIESDETLSVARTWLDGEPMAEFDDWSTPEAVQTALDEARAAGGERITYFEFFNPGSPAADQFGSAHVSYRTNDATLPDGEPCVQQIYRFLSATTETTQSYYPMMTPVSGCVAAEDDAPPSVADLTGEQAIDALATITPPAEAGRWVLTYDDRRETWAAAAYKENGIVLGTATID